MTRTEIVDRKTYSLQPQPRENVERDDVICGNRRLGDLDDQVMLEAGDALRDGGVGVAAEEQRRRDRQADAPDLDVAPPVRPPEAAKQAETAEAPADPTSTTIQTSAPDASALRLMRPCATISAPTRPAGRPPTPRGIP